jgi:hypothetical protein
MGQSEIEDADATGAASRGVLIPHTQRARQFGICTKTLDEWARLGIVDPPVRINGRKYHRPGEPVQGRRR